MVNKPAGLPTQATLDKNRLHVYGILQAQLKAVEPNLLLALHHRLDRDTSGVLLFCKDRAYNEKVGQMFQQHQFKKIYWALTKKNLCQAQWTVKSFLAEKPAPRSKRMSLHSVKSGGKIAITHFEKMGEAHDSLWIQAQPQTGRMHQIRVHLSECGLPILGDDLYYPNSAKAPRMMLHAYQLIFDHPATAQAMCITAPAPQDFVLTRYA